jgi:hypothetical protein
VNIEVTVSCEGAVASVQMLLYGDVKHWEHLESLVGWMVEKTGYVFMSYELNVGQEHKLKVADKSFDNVAKFKYLGMTHYQTKIACVKKLRAYYTVRFIMFSMITNIYNNNNCSQPQEN